MKHIMSVSLPTFILVCRIFKAYNFYKIVKKCSGTVILLLQLILSKNVLKDYVYYNEKRTTSHFYVQPHAIKVIRIFAHIIL